MPLCIASIFASKELILGSCEGEICAYSCIQFVICEVSTFFGSLIC